MESAFLEQSGLGVRGFAHPHLAPLMVATEFLTQLEGPFWKQIRGQGLSYSYGISASPEDGLVHFNLFKAAHVVKAYAASRAIVAAFADGSAAMDATSFETAVSSAVFAVMNRERTATSAGKQSFLSLFRGQGAGYTRRLVDAVRAVTQAEAQRALEEYVLPLFDPRRTNVSVCCNPNKVGEVVADFAALGRTLAVAESLDAAFPDAEGGAAGGAPAAGAEQEPCLAATLQATGGREAEAEALKCACVRCRGPFSLPSVKS